MTETVRRKVRKSSQNTALAVASPSVASTEILNAKPRKSFLQSEVATYKIMSFLTTIPDPDELLSRAGVPRYQLKQLEFDDEIAQCIDTRREAVVATPWRVEPNQNRLGKWFYTMLEPHIDTLKRGCLDARFYGYCVFEVIYKKVAKGIGIDRLSLKPLEWFAPQRDGSLRYFPDDGSGGTEGVVCDPLKFLLVRCNATYKNPYGEALLSRLWFPVTWRREGWGMWLQFLETFGEPIILGQVANYQEFVEAMVAQGVRSTVAWQGIGTDNVSTINSSTPGEFERLENAILKRIQKLILGQTLTSDVGANGSYAVAAIHNEVRNDKRRADMRMAQMAGQMLVNMLATVNGFEPARFVMADDAGLEMHRAQRDSVIAPVLQASGFRLNRDYFLRNYDYNDDELEEVEDERSPEETSEDLTESTTINQNEQLSDTGERKAPVRNRSVSDE